MKNIFAIFQRRNQPHYFNNIHKSVVLKVRTQKYRI